MMGILGGILGVVMRLCYQLVQNYGVAIILFTLFTKVVLLPLNIWLHKNGIKIVKMQASLNNIKADYYGDPNMIADKQAALYKQEKYNPLVNLIPLAIQIILLMGLVEVIYHPLTYILRLPQDVIDTLVGSTVSLLDLKEVPGSVQLTVVDSIMSGSLQPALANLAYDLSAAVGQIADMKMSFLGVNICWIPNDIGGWFILVPLAAAFSSWLLCVFQNSQNVLQSEQGLWNKYGTMLLSVGLSLYLGWFVPCGVALYWVVSNVYAILQTIVLNRMISPQKYVDYDALEKSRARLAEIETMQPREHSAQAKANEKREKADYKRFFSVENKHFVVYSESSGFYKYFDRILSYLLSFSKLTIHYITSDPNDQIFTIAEKQPRIKAYYIGEKRMITLFMKMEADVVLMTLSDLGNYHYKRSYISKDIDYVYVFHYPLSTHMVLHTGALDHYDTILCVGDFQFDEIRATERLYGLPEKKLISCGYGQLEMLRASYEKAPKSQRERPKVLVAPSWQQDNILDSCIDELLRELLGKGFEVVVRPHPEYVKRYAPRMNAIVERYASYNGGDLTFELDFTSNNSIFDSDVVISDWSGTAYEFSFVTERPCIFVDTPPKINNPEYVKLNIEPLEFSLRDQIGLREKPDQLSGLADRIHALLSDDRWSKTIRDIRTKYIANFGHSGEVGGAYILRSIQDHIQNRKADR